MKTLLIFPPVWDVSQPFIAIPSLTAFLKQYGCNVEQMDLNIVFQDKVLSSEYLGNLIRTKELKGGIREKILFQAIVPDTLARIEQAKKDLKSEKFYNLTNFLNSKRVIINAFQIISSAYAPTRIDGRSYKMKYSDRSSREIMLAAQDRNENLFIEFYERYTIPEISRISPNLVGISITDYNQIIPAFTLTGMLKKLFPEIHITIGGFLMEYLSVMLKQQENFFGLFYDSLISGEGELPLLRLIQALEKKKCFDEIPNITFKKDDMVITNPAITYGKSKDILSVNDLPTPDYDGFPLEKYLAPEIVFPLRASKGCYWNKCTFCDDIRIYGNFFSQRRTHKVIEDMRTLKAKYQAKFVSFTDLSVSAKMARNWAIEAKKENLDMKWLMLSRLEKTFTKELCHDLKEGGCSFILFGMETASQRILDLIKKGTEVESMREVCRNVHNSGIWSHLFTFTGFPSETQEEVQQTIDFVLGMSDYIDSVGISSFILTKDTPIFNNPEDFGIETLYDNEKYDLNNSVGFKLKDDEKGADYYKSFDGYIKAVWERYNQPMWMLEKAQVPVFLYACHYGQEGMKKVVYPIKTSTIYTGG